MPKSEVTKLSEMYNRIERLCKDRGVNVTEMCRESGVPRSNLSDLKYGRTTALATVNLDRIAKFFDAEIKITNDNIQKIKKPLFSSWSKTLGKIDNVLGHTYENINNNDIVQKKQIGLLCFPEDAVKRIQEINDRLVEERNI